MGYYTEFRCRVTLKKDTPKLIIDTINSIINDYDKYYEKLAGKPMESIRSVTDTPYLPIDHAFGQCLRWDMLFHANNFDPENREGSKFNKKTRELSIHSEFKNYDDEIQLFIKWIRVWIDEDKPVEIWSKGEDSDNKNHHYYSRGL